MYKFYYTNRYGVTSYIQKSATSLWQIAWNPDIRKWLMRINLTCLMLLIAFMQVSLAANAQKISLSKKNAPLTEIFKELRRQSGYDFVINKDQIKIAKLVTILVNGDDLINVLDKCFQDQPFTYIMEDSMIIVVSKKPERVKTNSPTLDIKGKLVDEKGDALVGASIVIKGTDRKTTTDGNGEFFFKNIEENVILEISYVGYEIKTIKVNQADLQTIKLKLSNFKLEEVSINAGYYSVSKRELTGSISRVSSKDIENQPIGNVFSAMQGRMAGVSITQSTGNPGGGFEIQIRGRNSLRREGNEPMYIIDGVPILSETPSTYSAAVIPYAAINVLNSINPNDVESIEVLKDADATSIYGSRGANGVILVRTKKGIKGKTDFKVNSSYALNEVAGKMRMMNTEQYLDMRRSAYKNDGITTLPMAAYDVNGTWDQQRYTDWREELIGNRAVNTIIQTSVSGGTEHSSFLLNYTHLRQSTVLPADFSYRTNNLSGNYTYSSPDRRLELTLNNAISLSKNNTVNSDMTNKSLLLSPNAPALYDAQGMLNWENSTFTNPVADTKSTYLYSTSQFNSGSTVSYRLFPFLSAKLNGGVTYQSFEEFSLKPHTMYIPSAGLTSINSTSFTNDRNSFSYLLEPQLNGTFESGKHRFEALLGGTLQKLETQQGSLQGYGFESNAFIQNIAAAKTKVVSDQVRGQYNYAAVFGRLNYKYNNRYIVNLTARRDGSSRFGPNRRYGNFGAVGAAWLFGEEEIFKNLSWLSFGKLRGSFGTTGNDKIGDYQFLDTYTVAANIYDTITGLNPSRLYNPDFSWESTTKSEIGLDLAFFKDKINLSTVYYRNISANQLVGIPLPATTGFATIQSNLPAKVQNTGWEAEISAQLLKSAKFSWQTSINITVPRNKLLAFPGLQGSTYANQYAIGYPTTLSRLYDYQGLDPQTGLYRFTDFNGDGRISSPEDNKVIESLGVRYFGGWSNQFSFKRWSAAVLLQFVGQRNWNYNRVMLNPGVMNNLPIEALNAWTEMNSNAEYMGYSTGVNTQKNTLNTLFRSSTAAVGDASYARLKNVQINYRLPLGKLGIKEAHLYVQGQNLLTFTDYFGLDPEFLLTGYLPPLRTYAFGMQLTF